MLNFQNDRAIILQFPTYTGGKFISNCLSLSQHTVPQHALLAEHLLTYPTDYQYRFTKVIETLPPVHDMHNWISKYELGDKQLYGSMVTAWQQGQALDSMVPLIERLSQSSLGFFLVSHGHAGNLLKVWPNAKLIVLTNWENFYNISKQLKSKDSVSRDHLGMYCREKYESLSGPDWPSWQEFDQSGYNVKTFVPRYPEHIIKEMFDFYPEYQTNTTITFDIDNSMFDQDTFLSAMEQLYKKLNFDDFDPDLIGKFWQAYMDLHVDTSQNL
jgi:hypothetical protein